MPMKGEPRRGANLFPRNTSLKSLSLSLSLSFSLSLSPLSRGAKIENGFFQFRNVARARLPRLIREREREKSNIQTHTRTYMYTEPPEITRGRMHRHADRNELIRDSRAPFRRPQPNSAYTLMSAIVRMYYFVHISTPRTKKAQLRPLRKLAQLA